MTRKIAEEITGGLSRPSKMPCFGFSIPAQECKTGQKLRQVKGSVCAICYALKGRYSFQHIRAALQNRFVKLKSKRWVEAMSFLINAKEKSGYFRWHDSGDIQSVDHLKRIAEVCRNTKHIQHWLPTREYALVTKYVKEGNAIPANLVIRLSAYMVDGPPPVGLAAQLGVQTSGVSKDGFTCPSSTTGNACADCRACWNPAVANVSYKRH